MIMARQKCSDDCGGLLINVAGTGTGYLVMAGSAMQQQVAEMLARYSMALSPRKALWTQASVQGQPRISATIYGLITVA